MNEPLEPLDPELDALLDAERAAEFPSSTIHRVWSRVASAPVPAPSGSAAHAGARAWIASHAVAVVTSTFVLGVLTGAGGYRAASLRSAPAIALGPAFASSTWPSPRVAPSSSAIDGIERIDPAAPLPPVASAPSPSGRAAPSPTPTPTVSTLTAERALIDEARTTLSSGDAQGALALLDRHLRQFPRPRLGEEREALAVQALAALGRTDEAKRRAAALRASSPNSLFLPVVDRALRSIP